MLLTPQRHHHEGARRLVRPVRIALAFELGGDLDGAWWPHTASIARELPGLIGALHRPTESRRDRGFASPIPTTILWVV
jgi:hypothetical protein